MKFKIIGITVIAFIAILLISNDEEVDIEYFASPYVLYGDELSDEAEIEGNKLIQENEKLKIINQNIEIDVELPENSDVQSIELSHDKQYLAFDVVNKESVKIFVVNLETGEYEDLFEVVEQEDFNYNRYKNPHGLAWSPEENIIVFVGGHKGTDNDDFTVYPRLKVYHPELKLRRQSHSVSAVYTDNDVYGVRWDTDGEAIYYVVTTEDLDKYNLYRTSIDLYQTDVNDEKGLKAGEKYGVIEELNYKEVESWLEK